ncbi:MAG: prolipoprotein diacylglyceryl transferase [Armatimonadetes bacterium]|nr:prolipoprotein diacylglyceryl transferase [Armatimonadota bacterium]
MYPELFKVFGFPIRTFGLMLMVGVLLAWWVAVRRARRFGIAADGVATLGTWMLLAGIVGARLAYVAQDWPEYAAEPVRIMRLWDGGMTSFGGFLFGLIALFIWARIAGVRPVVALDLMAAPALIAIGVGRIGCFFNGCCYGGECALPWAVHFPDAPGPAHPAQLYATLMHWAAAGLLLLYERRLWRSASPKWKPGTFIALAFVAYGVVRFIYEFFRIGPTSDPYKDLPLTAAHFVSIFMVVVGVVWLAFLLSKPAREFVTEEAGGGSQGPAP